MRVHAWHMHALASEGITPVPDTVKALHVMALPDIGLALRTKKAAALQICCWSGDRLKSSGCPCSVHSV